MVFPLRDTFTIEMHLQTKILRQMLTLSLPRATIVAKLGYPLISIYSNRESLGNPWESHEI